MRWHSQRRHPPPGYSLRRHAQSHDACPREHHELASQAEIWLPKPSILEKDPFVFFRGRAMVGPFHNLYATDAAVGVAAGERDASAHVVVTHIHNARAVRAFDDMAGPLKNDGGHREERLAGSAWGSLPRFVPPSKWRSRGAPLGVTGSVPGRGARASAYKRRGSLPRGWRRSPGFLRGMHASTPAAFLTAFDQTNLGLGQGVLSGRPSSFCRQSTPETPRGMPIYSVEYSGDPWRRSLSCEYAGPRHVVHPPQRCVHFPWMEPAVTSPSSVTYSAMVGSRPSTASNDPSARR
jgi:hypothetical protein